MPLFCVAPSTASSYGIVYTDGIQRKGAQKIMRKMIWLLGAMLLLTMAPSVAAAENRGSIQIRLDAGDLAVTNGAVTLYQVGVRVEDGYRLAEGFGGGIVRLEDADSGNLAQWLAESAGESGTSMLLDADGNAVFPDLEEGLYMLVQTERMDGFYPILPILLTVPRNGEWAVREYRNPVPIVTEIPKTGQTILPYFGVLGMILSGSGLVLCSKSQKNRKRY